MMTDLLKLCEKRSNFMNSNAHGISYLLDPKHLGDGVPAPDRERIENLIYLHPLGVNTVSTTESQEVLFREYIAFRTLAIRMRGGRDHSIMWKNLLAGKTNAFLFWTHHGDQWPQLQKLALQVFSLAASSAASERNFSTFGFMHSKLRNRLGQDAVEKLVYIKTNSAHFTEEGTFPANFDESDDEDNDDAGAVSDIDALESNDDDADFYTE